MQTRTFQSRGNTPAPLITIAGGAAQQNAPLAGALDQLCQDGFQFTHASNGQSLTNAGDIMAALNRGDEVNVALKGSSFNLPVNSEERMEQYAFAQTKRDDLLPQNVAAALKQVANLKKNGIKFFSHKGATVAIGARIGPLWLLEAGSLYASYNDGNKVKVTSLDGLARSVVADIARNLGVAIPGLTDQTPPALQPRPGGAPTSSQARAATPAPALRETPQPATQPAATAQAEPQPQLSAATTPAPRIPEQHDMVPPPLVEPPHEGETSAGGQEWQIAR
jgi:hypothetical protein